MKSSSDYEMFDLLAVLKMLPELSLDADKLKNLA